ncbi:putative peroxiredoxin bcp [Rubripirellula tenax]|uniref:thioredoxin-dependent peroxiredoxin n=1 Tax=Rubripirellula tenax TaxID=2528015 RepID=A0A5C6EFB3_9BACT|nr:peroxiredoxin [Rubripirellula tenax]TWU47270.1 putative peroxiredoxin bcp [Rubripirellula tenax]
MLKIAFLMTTVVASLFVVATAKGKDSVPGVAVGDPPPSFELQDDTGKTWKSSDHFGKGPVVIYFYPADMTGGCTAQACGFRDNAEAIKKAGAEVIGISGDTVGNHQLFKQAHALNFTLLADIEGDVAKQFGVPVTVGEKSVNATIAGTDHRLVRNVTAKRWTFVVSSDGKVVYKDDAVKAKQDSERVLEVLERLK